MSNVLITGCSTGFGELAALTFADRGHTVVATMRTPGKSAALNERPDIIQLPLDVTSTDSVNAAFAEAISQLDRIHVVVNNAGVESFGAVHLFSDDEVAWQFDTNVTGVVRVVGSPDAIALQIIPTISDVQIESVAADGSTMQVLIAGTGLIEGGDTVYRFGSGSVRDAGTGTGAWGSATICAPSSNTSAASSVSSPTNCLRVGSSMSGRASERRPTKSGFFLPTAQPIPASSGVSVPSVS